jgi:hypothetical protein
MVSIEQLIDDAKCYEVVCNLRWPNGVHSSFTDVGGFPVLDGLALSNEQIAAELDLPVIEAQAIISQIREGMVVKKSVTLSGEVETNEVFITGGHKC